MLMTENYRAALSQDIYTMKAGSQVLQPRFHLTRIPIPRNHGH